MSWRCRSIFNIQIQSRTGLNVLLHNYDCLADTALDLVAAPASQAYVERVFSVCGMLTSGRRNRMSQSLEMHVRLKLNAKVFA